MLRLLKASLFAISFFIAASAAQAQSAGSTYTAKCQMCHGTTGLGDTPAGKAMGAHAFNSPAVVAESDIDLIAVIKNGKGKMPAFTGKLTDAEMSALVKYIHTLQK